MPYATHEEPFIVNSSEYPMEIDLCSLLETMKLGGSDSVKENAVAQVANQHPENVQSIRQPEVMHDDIMAEDTNYHSDTGSEKSSSSSNANSSSSSAAHPFEYGCAYLQVIHAQMQDYPTTNGEYLDAIFTHREILYSYPAAHHGCARAFSDLAYEIETRAWRADREADMEAVTAFRHEAWMIAATLAPVTTVPQADLAPNPTRSAHACIMMPMA